MADISTGVDFVNVQISTSKSDISLNEKRFPKDITIAELKNKLELVTGASATTMQIQLFSKDNKLVGSFDDNDAMLGAYPVEHKMRLHIIDQFLLNAELESNVIPKYEISEEQYKQRDDSVRSFMLKNKMGHYNEEVQKKKEMQEAKEMELTTAMIVGSRCKVTLKNAPTRHGTVMYKGEIDGLQGQWVGVKYDEPLGKNDGTFKEKRYFECLPKYGAFVKAVDVLMGDFPVEDFDLDEEI